MLLSFVPIATTLSPKVFAASMTLITGALICDYDGDNLRLLRPSTHIFFEFIIDNKAQSICLKVQIDMSRNDRSLAGPRH